MKQKRILFSKPAENWQQGCLLGNGFMGLVFHGGIQRETLSLSHLTFFSGSDRQSPYQRDAAEAFQKARQAAEKGAYEAVSAWTERFMGRRKNYGTNLPAGALCLDFEISDPDEINHYQRELNIEDGVAACRYETENGVSTREIFCSHKDRIAVLKLETSSSRGLSFRLSYDGGRCPYHTQIKGQTLLFETQALETLHSDGTEGTRLYGQAKICIEGGSVTKVSGTEAALSEQLRVQGASRAVIYLKLETDFQLKKEVPLCLQTIEIPYDLENYEERKQRHCLDFSEKMNRQELFLGTREEADAQEETADAEALLRQVRQGGDDKVLAALMYQYGRYLLLSSSREDSPLPAPLQGVWNDDVACRIGWTCDMHLDINTQMNYWISEPGNLSECHKPVFNWMEERLIPLGRKNAQLCYGMPGWAAELVSNAWGYAAPYWNKSLSPCPTGGVWMASDYAEHFRYHPDPEFLQLHALPVLEEAVQFFLNYVFEDADGTVTSGPSISPENAFLVNGTKQYASNGCTYEILMIRELFLEYLELCRALELQNQVDQTAQNRLLLQERVESVLERLLPYRILNDGTLAEWSHEFGSADLQHRHTSHLLGLFPYHQITPEKTPELAAAAEASIQAKLVPEEGWEDTGWARSLMVLYQARLKHGANAWKHLRSMQETLTGENLLVMHPPTRGAAAFQPVYELDGNTGFAMGVLELLVQKDGNQISLLPALPDAWPDGQLSGVSLPGEMTLDLEWKNGAVLHAKVSAKTETEAAFRYKQGLQECVKNIRLTAGETWSL